MTRSPRIAPTPPAAISGCPASLFSGTQTQPIGNTSAALDLMNNPGQAWFGGERLVSYGPGGADRVLEDLRHLAARCVTDGSNTNELEPGPVLGDESVDLVRTTADRMQFDVVCVRVGDNLIIINSYDMPVGAQTPIDQAAAATYRAFIAG